jgi:glycosyltransferase involved in cell wall biosynthesis
MSVADGAAGTALPPRQRPLVMVTTIDLGARDGPSLHFLNLARQLARLGHEVTIISPSPQRAIERSLIEGIGVRHVAGARRLHLPNVLNVFPLAFALWRLSPAGKRLYLRSSPATGLLCRVARRAVSHVVVEYNGWLSDDVAILGYPRPLAGLARLLQRAEARRADKVRAVTSGLGAVLAAEGVDPARIAVIGNGTDTAQFRPLDQARCRSEMGIAGHSRVLAFVGNLWPAVDLDAVFDAMVILKGRGRQTRMLIAGDGVRRARLEQRARDVAGPDAARFLGHLSPAQANVVLGAADVAVAPFHRRRNARIGLSPLKIRDYAAAGRPCVATDLGGIDELRDEPWMFLARAESAQSYADAIDAALAADLPALSRQARTYAERNFDWKIVARRVSALIP